MSTTAMVTDLNGRFSGEFFEFERRVDPDLDRDIEANVSAPFETRAARNTASSRPDGVETDDVERSFIPVPEPGPFELLMLGLFCMGIATRLRRRT